MEASACDQGGVDISATRVFLSFAGDISQEESTSPAWGYFFFFGHFYGGFFPLFIDSPPGREISRSFEVGAIFNRYKAHFDLTGPVSIRWGQFLIDIRPILI
jgi:hypothetical protein